MEIDFKALFDVLPTPFMVLDSNHEYVEANEAYQRAVMRGREELLGRNLFDLFPNDGESGKRLRESFNRVFETGKPDTLAYIPYDIPGPDGEMEQRFWTAVHTPVHDTEGRTVYLIQNTVDVTDIARLRMAASLPFRISETRLLERAREAEEQHHALQHESESFRRLFQQAPAFIAIMSGADFVFTFANDAYKRLIGGRDVIGMPVAEALPEVAGQGFFELLADVYRTGKPVAREAQRLMLQRGPGEPPQETFVDFSYDAIRDGEGNITGIFVQGMDRTESVRAQNRQKLLVDELNHRVKNTLATVQSIASQTMRSATDLNSARQDFEARLVALSSVHNLLSAQKWSSASLSVIVEQATMMFDARRVIVSGPPVTLNSKASIAVALILHELSTNAAKYGALSGGKGKVDIEWRRETGGWLVIDWNESDGPPVEEPTRKGFGSRMILALVAGELGGDFVPSYDEDGFKAHIVIDGDALIEN